VKKLVEFKNLRRITLEEWNYSMGSLKNKTISSMILSFTNTIATQFIQLVIQIVLARILMPKDFGIVGMITIFITLSQVFVDSGFTTGLVREKNSSQEDYSTIFFFNLLVSVLLYIILFFSAGVLGDFYKEPQIKSITRVISLVLIINAIGLIQRTMLTKKINFKAQTVIDITAAVISGIIAIVFALLGFGVWSLVIKTLTMQLLQTVFLLVANRWKPTFVFSVTSFKKLFHFSWKLLVANLLSKLYDSIYYMIIGKTFTATDLGYYSKAKALADIAENSVTNSLQKVSYPVLSNIQNDGDRLRSGYRKLLKISVYIAFPVMLGLAAVAPELLIILLGEKWEPAIPYFQILCVAGMFYPLHAINLNILQVKGRSDLYLTISIINEIIGFLMIALVLFFKFGIIGLMCSIVLDSFISFFTNSYGSKSLLKYSTWEQIKDVFSYFIISIAMCILLLVIGNLVSLNIFLMMFLKIFIGVIFYILMSLIFGFDVFFELIDVISTVFMKINKNKSMKNEKNKQ